MRDILLHRSIGCGRQLETTRDSVRFANDVGIRRVELANGIQVDEMASSAENSGKPHEQCSLVVLLTHNPPAACATARNSARPLFIVSSHSLAGSES